MQGFTRALLQYRTIVFILFLVALAAGGFALSQLDIEAYPDPSPPIVEIITQNPAWSAEEMEQQVTVPVETALNGTPQLDRGPLHQHLRPLRRQALLRLQHVVFH